MSNPNIECGVLNTNSFQQALQPPILGQLEMSHSSSPNKHTSVDEGWIYWGTWAEIPNKLMYAYAKIGTGFVLMQVQNKESASKQDRKLGRDSI